jgi:hypothetical protein
MKKTSTTTCLILKVRIAFVTAIAVMLSAASLSAQCSVVGTGTVTGNVNFGSSNNWANPNRATLSDDLWSRVQLAPGETSKYLMVADYGWVIPSSAIITGIEVKIECHQEDFVADFADASIVLMQYGNPVGADLAGTGYYDDKDYVNTYGGPTELWGTSWTPADVMDPGFGVLYSVTRNSGDAVYYMFVDYVELTVYYTGTGCLLPVTYKAYDVTLQSDKTVKIDWVTSTEANTDRFNVERSTDGQNFVGIGSVLAQGNASDEATYSFVDEERLSGTAFYRLQQMDLNGQSAYSEIRAVSSDALGTLTITTFPSPATDHINVQGLLAGGEAQLYDLSGKLVLQKTLEADISALDVSTLTPGMYLLNVHTAQGKASQRIIVQ